MTKSDGNLEFREISGLEKIILWIFFLRLFNSGIWSFWNLGNPLSHKAIFEPPPCGVNVFFSCKWAETESDKVFWRRNYAFLKSTETFIAGRDYERAEIVCDQTEYLLTRGEVARRPSYVWITYVNLFDCVPELVQYLNKYLKSDIVWVCHYIPTKMKVMEIPLYLTKYLPIRYLSSKVSNL